MDIRFLLAIAGLSLVCTIILYCSCVLAGRADDAEAEISGDVIEPPRQFVSRR